MMKYAKLVAVLVKMTPNELDALAIGLVWFDEGQAERLKNSISFQQQEQYKRAMDEIQAREHAMDLEDFDRVSAR